MSTRPRLTRSIPFWLLIVGSLASTAGGAYVLLDRLGGMDARLTDGSATSNDVYVGQIWAVLGAILVGVGLVGFALALTVGALRSFVPVTTTADAASGDQIADPYGYRAELGYEANEDRATDVDPTPVDEAAPSEDAPSQDAPAAAGR